MSAFVTIVKRDLTLALRRKNEVITSVFFFVVVAALFPLGIGPEMNTLRLVAPGILWVGALLASMLSLGRMFAADYADGTLDEITTGESYVATPGHTPILYAGTEVVEFTNTEQLNQTMARSS